MELGGLTMNPRIRKGDKFTYLGPNNKSFYTALEDSNGKERIKTLFTTSSGETYHTSAEADHTSPVLRIIERVQEDNNTMNTDNNNDVKLKLAADFGLQAKFNYTNKSGETHDVRLSVEDYDGEYVEGVSYDSFGAAEGYKRYILDHINDSVVIR